MSFPIKITSARIGIPDRDEQIRAEVAHLVRLVKSPIAYYQHLQSEQLPNEPLSRTFERVENDIERRTGLRHYGSYESFRVVKCRIQKRLGIGKQPTLFD